MRDPNQYAKFSDERSRPFFELLNRVPERDYRQVFDLGCGSGDLPQSLSARWPKARVLGLDSSESMMEKAQALARPANLEFRLGDISDFDEPADLISSNAALHWLGDHADLFPKLLGVLRRNGVLAVQMPNNFQQPSHLLLEQTARSPRWAAKLQSWRQRRVEALEWYTERLMR